MPDDIFSIRGFVVRNSDASESKCLWIIQYFQHISLSSLLKYCFRQFPRRICLQAMPKKTSSYSYHNPGGISYRLSRRISRRAICRGLPRNSSGLRRATIPSDGFGYDLGVVDAFLAAAFLRAPRLVPPSNPAVHPINTAR